LRLISAENDYALARAELGRAMGSQRPDDNLEVGSDELPPIPGEDGFERPSTRTEQSVAQYLRDPSSRHGILVVASSGPAKTWMAGEEAITSFADLVKRLRVEAERVCKESGMDALSVVGIDFH